MRGSYVAALLVGAFVAGLMLLTAPPASAATLTGRALGSTSISLQWAPECLAGPPGSPCNGYKTTGYYVYLRNGSFQASWQIVDMISNPAISNDTVIGLQPATSYQFRVTENIGWGSQIESNIVTIETLPPPNSPPSIAVTSPAAGQSYVAGTTIPIEWVLSDDHDGPENLVVYLNYTGPSSGPIAGPLSGRTTRLQWTIPLSLSGGGYRVTAVVLDSRGASRVTEGPEFTVLVSLGPPPGGPWIWVFSTGILSIASSALTAALLLAFRVELSEWYRRARDRRKQRQARAGEWPQRPPSPP